ncbi:hypothetical protein [Pseudomonas aeruginosa]|uniref:hypothetical protein n=1 Tax=Pseudomonas aeruginosa TaxID=287 RepID=UPI0024430901|nr:hypothetical protein [Pseudomonas aeruginosa]
MGDAEFSAIISDVAAGHYSDLHLATFITACAGDRLDLAETVSLTKAMIGVGDRSPGRCRVQRHHLRRRGGPLL